MLVGVYCGDHGHIGGRIGWQHTGFGNQLSGIPKLKQQCGVELRR
jgi:hypothetical protein